MNGIYTKKNSSLYSCNFKEGEIDFLRLAASVQMCSFFSSRKQDLLVKVSFECVVCAMLASDKH